MTLGLLIAAFGLCGVFVAATLGNLENAWATPEYSHCPLLIVVAAGWAYHLYRSQKLSPCPSARGLFVVGLAVVMQIFGDAAANDWISHYALVVLAMGLVIALLGMPAFRVLFPALFLLSFAVPLPPLMLANLTSALQLWSSTLSVAGLNLLGVPVYQQGNIIDLGTYKLQVAEACSGLRYLFPLLGFGYLFAMFFETMAWKRVILIVATIPVTIVMNALRILIVGVSVDRWGIDMAEGVLHEFEGMVVFLGCLLLLFFLHCGLSVIGRDAGVKPALATPAMRLPLAASTPTCGLLGALIVIMCLGLVGQHFITGAQQGVVPPRESFASFPLHLDAWEGQPETLPSDQIDILKFNDYILADYKRGADQVNFYVAYYASQRHGAAPHSPLVCIGGSGWEIARMTSAYLVRNGSGMPLLHVNRALIKSGDKTELVYFWFQERGRTLTSTPERKWYLLRDALTTGRTDGALLRVATPIAKGSTEADADARLAAFLTDTLPLLNKYIPD